MKLNKKSFHLDVGVTGYLVLLSLQKSSNKEHQEKMGP